MRYLLICTVFFLIYGVSTSPIQAQPQESQEPIDTPLIELYPFPVWYRYQEGKDYLVVQDPTSESVSRFENLGFSTYPHFDTESLGGALWLRLEGPDTTGKHKRWYLNPATGQHSEILRPLSPLPLAPDQLLQCDGQQRTRWVAQPLQTSAGHGVGIFDVSALQGESDQLPPTQAFPLPSSAQPWRSCQHQNWAVAYHNNALYLYDIAQQQRFAQPLPEHRQNLLLNLIFRQHKLWVWWRVQPPNSDTVSYTLSRFDLNTHTWKDYPAQPLPFLPLQDLPNGELLLGPPWLPSAFRAPYFRLDPHSDQRSAPIWVENQHPGQIRGLQEVFEALPPPEPGKQVRP